MDAVSAPGTIGAALAQARRQWPAQDAYLCRGRHWSFAATADGADRVAEGLLELGLARGDRIGVIGLNHVEWLLLFYAAARIGVAVVGLSVRYRDNEIAHMIADAGVQAVFTVAELDGFDYLAMLARLAPALPSLRQVVVLDAPDAGQAAPPAAATAPQAPLTLSALARSAPQPGRLARAAAAVHPDDLAMVIYTSGTTGKPKGAGLTHRSLLAAAGAQAAHVRTVPGDHLQLALPLNHVGGITCGVLNFLLGGGTLELVPVFKAELVLEMMRRHPPTLFSGVPTMATLLLSHPASAGVDLSRVRLVVVGGSTVDGALLEQLQRRMPQATVMNLYGLSECSGAIVMTPWQAAEADVLQSIGQVFRGSEARVLTPQGEPAAAGEVGELCFRGPGVAPGYIGAAAGAAGFDAGGWLRSGDLGCQDARGYLFLKGRMKDMYIQGGFNVYPAEVEGVIARHPEVLMVAGIGVPDPVLGEVGRYYIVARPGSALRAEDVRAFCGEHLADYKVPRQVVLRAELPMTPAGKIHKAALREEGA